MALPSFTVTGNFKEILGDLIGAELAETAATRAVIKFTSNIPNDFFVRFGGVLYPAPEPVVARVADDGSLVLNDDEDPVTLLANDAGLSFTGVQWQVDVDLPNTALPKHLARKMRNWWIDAPSDGGSADLAPTTPVPSLRIQPAPVLSNADSLSDATVIGKQLIRAASQAAARTAIGAAAVTDALPIVTPEDFGAVGDGVTDDTAALDTMFNSYTVNNGGSCILIPYGKVYLTDALDIKSNTYVFGAGTLKMRSDDGGGGGPGVFLTFKNGVENVTWIGPTLDCNHKLDINGFDIGQDNPAPTDFKASNIYVVATVKGARIKTSLEDSNNMLFAGGGKAVAIGSATRNVYLNIRALDCDIGASIECTSGGDQDLVENVVLDLQTNDCHRTSLFLNGALGITADHGSAESADSSYGIYTGVKVRLRALNGNDATIAHPVGGATLNNYDTVGVITMNYASGVDVDAYVSTPNRCTLVRGPAWASRIRVNALLDEMQDGWDTRPLITHDSVGYQIVDNIFEADIHAYTHHGVVVRPHRVSGTRVPRKTKLDVSMWCENGVGLITQSDGTTDGFGTSVAYRFRDMRSDPVKEIVSDSSYITIPNWSNVRHFNNLDLDTLAVDAIQPNSTSTATAAGTTTLTIASTAVQIFTGTTTQTVKLPTTGVVAGQTYTLIDNSTGALFVQASNGSAILSQFPSSIWSFTAKVNTPTAPSDWQISSGKLNAASSGGTIMLRDSDGIAFAGNFIADKESRATAAGTTTLTVSNAAVQEFTGSTTQTVKLPTSFVTAGQQYTVINNSTGSVTVQSSGANTIATVTTLTLQLFVARVDTPTTAAHWRAI